MEVLTNARTGRPPIKKFALFGLNDSFIYVIFIIFRHHARILARKICQKGESMALKLSFMGNSISR